MSEIRCFVPLVTPIRADGSVCPDSICSLIQWLDRPGIGYMPCMSTGEGAWLSDEQWSAMVQYVLELVDPDRVCTGIQRPTLPETVKLLERAKLLGVKHIIIGSPVGATVTQEEIEHYFKTVFECRSFDFFIYHEHDTSHNDIDADTLIKLARYGCVSGIKDSYSEPRSDRFIQSIKECGVSYFVGWEERIATSPRHDGNVVGLANIEPSACYLASLSANDRINSHICALSEEYSLFADDWYHHLKRKLKSMNVIAESRLVQRDTKQTM